MHSYLRRILILTAMLAAGLAFAAEDPIFKAMEDEMARSMTRLRIDPSPAPYFLSYRVEDDDQLEINARYGALTEVSRQQDRYLYVEARVGDKQLDNTGFVGSWQDVYNIREQLVEADAYNALRHRIWLATDGAYKSAVENLARKRAYLQTHPSSDSLPDFSEAPKLEHSEAPVKLEVDAAAWEATVRDLAAALSAYPALADWKVQYWTQAATERYLNSERSRNLKSGVRQFLEVSATAQAADGQRLTGFVRLGSGGNGDLASAADLLASVKRLGDELTAAAAAPALDEYAGPVLFSDYAAAQLISELFVQELSPVREFVSSEEWVSQMLPVGKLAERLNRRVMPEFVTVTDRPDLKEWKGRPLFGYQTVDDEGVASEAITLVDKGRLVALPMGRQPSKRIKTSNGHARMLINQWTQPTPTNLFVKAENTLPKAELVNQLRKLAGDFGNEYGLVVTMLEVEQLSSDYSWIERNQEEPTTLTAPVVAYKVYVKDGRLEPVRGLIFDDVNVRTLRDIGALGKDEQVYNIGQPSLISQVTYPLSIVTPSILVEEMELKSNPAHEPPPFTPRPEAAR